MAAPMSDQFSAWLSSKLLQLDPDVDVDVFVGYITSILEDDESESEVIEALSDFLGQVTEEDTVEICTEIVKKWQEFHKKENENENTNGALSVDDRLSAIMEKSKISVALKKEINSGDAAHKKAILQQYAQVSDGEETDDDDAGSAGDSSLSKNTNASDIDKAEREKRDKMKQAHDEKKDKDKTEREKQKQKQLDRKDKEKQRTQKGEKRR